MVEACARAPIINYYSIRISNITPVIFECGVIIIEMLVHIRTRIHTRIRICSSLYVVNALTRRRRWRSTSMLRRSFTLLSTEYWVLVARACVNVIGEKTALDTEFCDCQISKA